MSGAARQVVVVGGGVIGAACAHYLNKAGWAVTVLERGEFGMGCSHANCGFVCPSHVLPLAAPGAVGSALRSLFRHDAPLRIKPRFDPRLWAWLYRFARRCTVPHMLEAGRAVQALLNSSRRLYDKLMREEKLDCEWQTNGLLFVFHSQKAMDHYAETDRLLRQSFDLAAKRYDGDALSQLEPALKPGLAGGWLYENDAHLRPDKLMSSWQRVLEAHGVTVRTQCEMKGFVRGDGGVRAVATSRGEVPADAVVVAAGAWTPLLAEHLGGRVPIQPGKGYSITMPRPALCPKFPLIFEEHRVAVTPMQSGYRIGSTMEFAGYDATLNRQRLDYLRTGASHYLREPFHDPVEEEWFGWRPMTYDGKPIIDRSPVWSNVWIAAGHNMLGLSMAPATGKLVAELVGKQPPHLDPAPYAVSRFS
jgi:D-amino-acid dehydrogenase